MQDFQRRVIEEKADLDVRLEKLREFIFSDVFPTTNEADAELLKQQEMFMRNYSDVLGLRIATF